VAVEAVSVVWRTLMRVRSAVGDYDGVVSTFALCQRPLRAAEIAPAAATRALLTSCAAEHPFRRIHVRTPTLISWRSDSH
jgi:hypothetical protein